MMNTFPKISIITPNYNGATYLEATIRSILDQNYPNLEYIIIDGGSIDNSVEIIKRYEKHLAYWISEQDNGLYDALNKGFRRSTGDIMGWLNSDDMLYPNSLYSLSELFLLPGVKWIQGVPTGYDEQGRTISILGRREWSKFQFWGGHFQWIQQESTFWHRDLWNATGAFISTEYKYAGDMELWNRFFRYEKLYTPGCLIGGFRLRSKNQLSLDFLNDYLKEAESILKGNLLDEKNKRRIHQISLLQRIILFLKQSKIFNHEILIRLIQNKVKQLNEFPPSISFDRKNQKFSIAFISEIFI
jgi:glycosyltransferase involved in cell wall biosynthesis